MFEQDLRQFKGWNSVMNGFKVVPEIKLIYTLASLETMRELDITRYDLDGISIALNKVKDMDIAVFIYEMDNGKSKVSFRSRGYNVNSLSKEFGGGGHKMASGAVVDGTPTEVIEKIIENLKGKK